MIKKGNWIIKNTRLLYKNPWVKFKEDEVVRPDGKDGIYATVDILPGVAVIAVDKERHVYLLKNYQYAIEKFSLTVAGGSINKNEEPLDAAKRELKEEVGLVADKWTSLHTADEVTSGIINSHTNMFLAENLSEQGQALDGTEEIEILKIPLSKAVEMVLNGEITHPVTALLVLKANLLL
ncbi:MAG: NUDIX hydrolase [Patescibacteria group bacterium]|nr:NUDIX hydrolase [Patescibacteria group bacterium]